MSAHVLLNLLNELGKIRCKAMPRSILSVFSQQVNKFNIIQEHKCKILFII